MPLLRFVHSLTDEVWQPFEALCLHLASFALCQRSHTILLNDKRFTNAQLHEIFAVDCDKVSARFTSFEQFGIGGSHDASRFGRPPIYTDDEIRQFQTLINAGSRQRQQAHARLLQATGNNLENSNIATRTIKCNATDGAVASGRRKAGVDTLDNTFWNTSRWYSRESPRLDGARLQSA